MKSNSARRRVLLITGNLEPEQLSELRTREDKRYSIELAETCDHGQKIVEQSEPFAVVIIDSAVSGASEPWPPSEVFGFIQFLRRETPASAISVLIDPEEERSWMSMGAATFNWVFKPVNWTNLHLLVRHALEHHELESLTRQHRLTTSINASLDLSTTVDAACRSAVELLDVDHSGLVVFDPDLRFGEVRSEFPPLGSVGGEKVPISGIEAEERLINTGEPIVVEDLERANPLGAVGEMLRRHGVRSTMIFLVSRAGRIFGSFSIETIGRVRRFSDADIKLGRNFAEQVGIAIDNARLYEESRVRTEQLEAVRDATLKITSLSDHRQLLDTVIDRAISLLGAQSGGIYRRNPDQGLLTILRDSKRSEIVGRMLHDGEGMAGRLVTSGQPYEMTEDYSKWPHRATAFRDTDLFGAVLEVPLKLEGEVTGVLYVDDVAGRQFTKDEAELLVMFADYVAASVDRAEKRQYLNRLIASSPIGIVAADRKGRIIEFNKRAEELTDLKKKDILNTSIGHIYSEQDEDRRIGRLLHLSADGSIEHDTVLVKPDLGEIPIRLSATWLRGVDGEISGSIGYFEDARTLEQMKKYVSLLTDACSLIVSTKTPATEVQPDALQRLAELLVTLISVRYCRILLFNERRNELAIKAEFFAARKDESLPSEIGKSISARDLPELHSFANSSEITVLSMGNAQHQSILGGLSGWMRPQLNQKIESQATVPLRRDGFNIGVLELGEVRGEHRSPITAEKLQLVQAIVSLSTAIIERLERNSELEKQSAAIHAISHAFHLPEVMRTIVQEARKLFRADSCALWTYDDYQKRFTPEEMIAEGLDEELVKRLRAEESAPGKTASVIMAQEFLNVPNVHDSDILGAKTKLLCQLAGIESFCGILLKAGEDPVGVLYLNYNRKHGFIGQREFLGILAMVSGLSLKRARLLYQLSLAKLAAEGVAQNVVLGNREPTLQSVADEVMNTVGCDLVTLYEYEANSKFLVQPPTIGGERLSTDSVMDREPGSDSLLFKILEDPQPKPLWVDDTSKNEMFVRSRFTQEEEIKSCAVIPLMIATRRVGIMFVNYRTAHRFAKEENNPEKGTVMLLANQAAVAIRNLQLYDSIQRKEKYLETLYLASKEINGSFARPRKEILQNIVSQAFSCVAGGKLQDPSFGIIQWYDEKERTLTFETTHPPEVLPRLCEIVGKTRSIDPLHAPQGKKGLTGLAVETRRSQMLNGPYTHPDRLIVDSRMISELVVPLIDSEEDRVLGVLSVQSDKPKIFAREDQETLEALGELSVMAIKNLDLLDELQHLLDRLQRTNEALEEADRKKTEFFENVSHNLKTPMTTIIPILSLMFDGEYGDLPDEVRDRTGLALDAAKMETRLIKNLLETRRLDHDRNQLNLEVRDILQLTQKVISEFRYQIEKDKINLKVSCDPNEIVGEVDGNKLDIAIMNLIENAVKFANERVEVLITSNDRDIEISIEDDGIGIPPEYIERIFERGFIVPESGKPNSQGTGLGLDIAAQHVKLHRGKITVDSKPGQGARFAVRIPIRHPLPTE